MAKKKAFIGDFSQLSYRVFDAPNQLVPLFRFFVPPALRELLLKGPNLFIMQ